MGKFILHSDQSSSSTLAMDSKLIRSLSGKKDPKIGFLSSKFEPKKKHFAEVDKYYQSAHFQGVLCIEPENLNDGALRAVFSEIDVLHLSSGDVRSFMGRLAVNNTIAYVLEFSRRDKLIVGVSAGAMILGPTLGLGQFFGDKQAHGIPGLGLLSFELAPHWSEISMQQKKVETYAKAAKIDVYPLADGEVLTVNGKKISCYLSGAATSVSPLVISG